MEPEVLVREFADNVVAQTKAIERGDAKTGNKHARRYIQAFEKLRGFGDEGREALSALLEDERPDVRVMAAAYLLRYCEEEARRVLEAEAKGLGLVAFGASEALRRWDEGAWALDPVEPTTN